MFHLLLHHAREAAELLLLLPQLRVRHTHGRGCATYHLRGAAHHMICTLFYLFYFSL
jgi:hypothetical protein